MREPIRMTEVLDAAHVLIGVVGWATVGLALSSLYPLTLVVLVGMLGASVTARAPRTGLALETIPAALGVILVGPEALAALTLGVAIVVVGAGLGQWSARKKHVDG
jgi:hypothetical protein